MNELERARRRIDGIDRKMAALFEERMAAVRAVAAYKKEQGLSVTDEGRERELRDSAPCRLSDSALLPYYLEFLEQTVRLSKAYQTALMTKEEAL